MLAAMRQLLAAALALSLAAAIAACRGGGDDAPAYDVTVTFNAQYTEDSLRAVTEVIRVFDDGADIRVQESFPPVLRARARTRRQDLCETVLGRLYPRKDVANLDCQPAASAGGIAGGDTPVSATAVPD